MNNNQKKMSFTSSPAIAKLFFTEAGKGKSILLLHGWVSDSHDWMWQLPELEKHYHTVAVDLRGHGRSQVMASGEYTPDHYVSDIIALIENEFKSKSFVLIGHSMGAQISARVAALRPDLVDAVVSVDGSLGFAAELSGLFEETSNRLQTEDPVEVTSAMLKNFDDGSMHPAMDSLHIRRMKGMPLAPFRESFAPLFVGQDQIGQGLNSEIFLKKIKQPFYHMCRYQEQADKMRTWFSHPKSKVEMWDKASHWIMQDRHEEVTKALIEWIDAL
jgi:Predicted hydrolases or acyltransferases (alpha/beta hydrolase superfamily)